MNVLNDNWLFVRYNTGKVKQISVRQAFLDAEKIKDIETPTFHGTTVSLYDVPVIQFLSILLLAAYFKPANKFKAHQATFNKELTTKGWDEKVLTKYFDKWEKRFNLFDEKYPFLQDIRLKEEIKKNDEESLGFISRSNLLAPGGNNAIFEHNSATKTELIDFKPELDELVYILLYLRALGTSPMALYYPHKSLSANASMFMLNKGKNLKETIIANCIPLRESNVDEHYDRPIWEFDNITDIADFNIEDIGKNVLLCTYFPMSMYIKYDGEVKDIIIARSLNPKASTKEEKTITAYDIINNEAKTSVADAYVFSNPWAIKKYGPDPKTKQDVWSYKEWRNDIKLLNLCIEITQHTPVGCSCNLISTDFQSNPDVKNVIYYREYDGMKSNVLSFGKYNVEKGILTKLQNDKNHEKAQKFQDILDSILNKFYIFKDSELSGTSLNDCKFAFSKYAENYFFTTFVPNITKNGCVEKTTELFIEEAKKIVKRLEAVTNNPLKYAEAYRKFSGSLNKLKEGT